MISKNLEKFREKLKSLSCDCALISNDTNRNYLTGFMGDESFALISEKKGYFITDSRYVEQAKIEVLDFEILEYKGKIEEFINDILVKNNIKSLAIEEEYTSLKKYEIYKETFKNIEIKKLGTVVEDLRVIKNKREVELISKAANIADNAFEHIMPFIKPGVSEEYIALKLEMYMRGNGASGVSFPTIAASGKRSSLPHGMATDKIIEKGDFITLDYGCIYKGYCSDMTRTLVVGKASPKQREIYNIVLEANKAVIESVKEDITCFELDSIARDIITNRGYGNYFRHGLGHGVGREIHEMPRVSPKSNEVLKKGMIITDEPGIYIENFGGVRIEDLLVVTENGCKVLSNSPKELIEL